MNGSASEGQHAIELICHESINVNLTSISNKPAGRWLTFGKNVCVSPQCFVQYASCLIYLSKVLALQPLHQCSPNFGDTIHQDYLKRSSFLSHFYFIEVQLLYSYSQVECRLQARSRCLITLNFGIVQALTSPHHSELPEPDFLKSVLQNIPINFFLLN